MFIGIDPGIRGGIACIYDDHDYLALPLPTMKINRGKKIKTILDPKALLLLLYTFIAVEKTKSPVIVAVEAVNAMPNQGVTSMFGFGRSVGILVGVSTAVVTDTVLEVRPQLWKKIVLGDDHTKQGAIDYCNRVFPDVNLVLPRHKTAHDGMADALCIAQYLKITR